VHRAGELRAEPLFFRCATLQGIDDRVAAIDLVINGRDQIWPAGLGRRVLHHRILVGRLGLDHRRAIQVHRIWAIGFRSNG
jgi:hypothetical protein